MSVRLLQRSFSGGEVTPEFWGQVGDAKYQFGLATCRNFVVLPHGPAANRAGFAYVNAAKLGATRKARLLPFVYSTTQTMVLEFGHQYVRFHTLGATLLTGAVTAYSGATAYGIGDLASSGGVVYYCIAPTTGNAPPNVAFWYALSGTTYEIPTPYLEADLFDLHTTQSADVFTIVHPSYAPMELRRLGATKWVLSAISFASNLPAPGSVAAVAGVGAGATSYAYKVVAVGVNRIDKSLASASASCTNNLLTTGNYNTITWAAVAGAQRYQVYLQRNGLYGYIGQTDALTFKDDNVTADISNTPPEANNPFPGANDYPGAVGYFEQRRWFAGTINKPQNFYATRSGTESDMTYSLPTRDDDALSFRVAARENNTIRHIVALTNLLLLTSSAEWRVASINTDAVTPTSVNVRTQSYIGANNAQPVVVNNSLVYVAARGGHVREMAYSFQASGYQTGDVSLRAPHLFDGFDVTDIAYSKAPYPLIWMVSTSGKLLGLTYVPEQQIGSWHQHDTDGTFESCTVVAEGSEDVLYVMVKRTVNSATVRYIERQASRRFATQADAFFVDAGATYNGAPTTSISGLGWLEGKTVSILADGAVHRQLMVTGGAITLDNAASKVQIGLPYVSDLQTLPATYPAPDGGQGRVKNANKAYLRVYQSGGIFAGPTFDALREFKQRTTEPYGSPPSLKTDEIEIVLTPAWQYAGQVCVRQTAPLPLTLVSMTLEIALGG